MACRSTEKIPSQGSVEGMDLVGVRACLGGDDKRSEGTRGQFVGRTIVRRAEQDRLAVFESRWDCDSQIPEAAVKDRCLMKLSGLHQFVLEGDQLLEVVSNLGDTQFSSWHREEVAIKVAVVAVQERGRCNTGG